MTGAARRLRWLVAVPMLIGAALLVYIAVAPRPVRAQVLKGSRLALTTAGPIQMASGERALIGLLLPAVQTAQVPFRLALFGADGSVLATIPIAPVAGGGTRTAFFDVFFADGSVRVLDRATGGVVFSGDLKDGMIIVVCLPAVQDDGPAARPIAGSVQLFSGAQREQIIGMCDGSV